MKRLLTAMVLFLLVTSVFTSCEKDITLSDDLALESFTFEPASNQGLTKTINATVEGKTIYIRVPNAVDIKAAVPSFQLNNPTTVAFIGNKVIESGITPIDISEPTKIRFSAESSLSEYTIVGLKNAAILSFGFFAEDNPGILFRDYTAEITKLDINVDLPVDADITELTARYTTSDGATVKYNGGAFVSQQTKIDYSEPVSLVLSDDDMEEDEVFTVNVGRLTAPVWTEVQLPDFLAVGAAAALVEINPLTNDPYVMIMQSTSAPGGLRKAVMGGYDLESKTWKAIGDETGFSEVRAETIAMAFGSDGKLYAAYKDDAAGTGNDFGSITEYVNGEWKYVGGQQATHGKVTYLSIQVDENNKPYVGYVFAAAAAPYANRAVFVEYFDNNDWIAGNVFSGVGDAVYSKLIKGHDNKLYVLALNRTGGRKPTIFKLNNGSWEAVGGLFVGDRLGSAASALDFDADITSDGQIYLTYQAFEDNQYLNVVLHWNGQVWKQLGDVIVATTANSTGTRNNVAVKVAPNGQIFFAYADAGNGLKVTTFNKDTGNWNPSTQLSTLNGDKLSMSISKDGIPYLATIIDGYAKLFKYDIPGQ